MIQRAADILPFLFLLKIKIPRAGLEPATVSFEARYSSQLSYRGFSEYWDSNPESPVPKTGMLPLHHTPIFRTFKFEFITSSG